MRRVFQVVVLLLVCSSAFAGELVTDTLTSVALGNDQTVNIYLPTGYDESGATHYPVLYFLHGGHSARSIYFDLNDTLETVLGEGVSPMIIVYPNGGDISFFADSDVIGHYETHFLEEVIPHIEANYPVIAEKCGRALMGHSMGATGGAIIALTHPEMFAGFASIGGELSLHKMVEIMAPRVADEATLRYYPEPSMGTWCTFLFNVSTLWSPNPNAEYGCDPVVGKAGAILEDVFERWKPSDPYTIVEQAGSAFGLGIYIDAGSIDIWLPASAVMHTLLESLEIDHHYYVYSGDHNNLEIRYPAALTYLDNLFKTTLSAPEAVSAALPVSPVLVSSWPNPFNSSARITVELSQAGPLRVALYDMLGRQVGLLHEGAMPAGKSEMTLQADGLASGCYFLRAESPKGGAATKRILLMR